MDIIQYSKNLHGLTDGSPEFAGLSDDEQQETIKEFRINYLKKNPNADVDRVNQITEDANISQLRGRRKGRAIPELDIVLPGQVPGYKQLSKNEKSEIIEAFRLQIPVIAKNNPTQRQDTEYYLNDYISGLERDNNHQDFLIVCFVVYLLVLIAVWAAFWLELRTCSTAVNKKKCSTRSTVIFAGLFGVSTSALLYIIDLSLFIPIPLVFAIAFAAIILRYKTYCESCKNAVWAGQCTHCQEK